MTRTGFWFIGAVWALGVIGGVVLAVRPAWLPLPVPHFSLALIAGLILDVATRPAVQTGRMAPITMNERGLGVFGAALIGFGVTALLAPQAA